MEIRISTPQGDVTMTGKARKWLGRTSVVWAFGQPGTDRRVEGISGSLETWPPNYQQALRQAGYAGAVGDILVCVVGLRPEDLSRVVAAEAALMAPHAAAIEMDRLLSDRAALVCDAAPMPIDDAVYSEMARSSAVVDAREAEDRRREAARARLADFDARHPEVAAEANRRVDARIEQAVRSSLNA